MRVILEEPGRTSERKERLRGQIGVRSREGMDGCTIGPPHESEYAVEPVGVDKINPSDYRIISPEMDLQRQVLTTASVRCWPSTYASIIFRWGLRPRCSVTSFITCQATSPEPPPISLPSCLWNVQAMRILSSISALPVKISSNACGNVSILNGSKNPNVPIEKLRTGGTTPVLKREEACKMVPSPPRVMTRSIGREQVSVQLVSITHKRQPAGTRLKRTMDRHQPVNSSLVHETIVLLDIPFERDYMTVN